MQVADLPVPPAGKQGWPWTEASPPEKFASNVTRWPKVTVVTPSFNQGEFLEETIRSVLLQDYPNLEYLIIDGGSTDDSVKVIRKYANYLTFWVSERDTGQANAINKGFRKATGEWVGWINSDDLLLPDALRNLMQSVNEAKDIQWVGGDVRFFHADGALDSVRVQGNNKSLADWLLVKSHFHQPGTFWSRDLFDQVSYLNEEMHYAFDWEFWCRLAASQIHPKTINVAVAAFREHEASKTCTKWDRFCAENEIIIKSYLDRFNGNERTQIEERRTSLACSRLRHESDRLLGEGRDAEVRRTLRELVTARPQILLKKTFYFVLFKAMFFHPIRSAFTAKSRVSERSPN